MLPDFSALIYERFISLFSNIAVNRSIRCLFGSFKFVKFRKIKPRSLILGRLVCAKWPYLAFQGVSYECDELVGSSLPDLDRHERAAARRSKRKKLKAIVQSVGDRSQFAKRCHGFLHSSIDSGQKWLKIGKKQLKGKNWGDSKEDWSPINDSKRMHRFFLLQQSLQVTFRFRFQPN